MLHLIHPPRRRGVILLALWPTLAWLGGCGFCSGMRLRADDDWSAEAMQLEQQMLAEVNARRSQGGSCGGQRFDPAPPLEPRPELARAARHHSLDMARRDYFDHCSLEGCDPGHRLDASGWPSPSIWAENIATQSAATPSTASAVGQLMDSPAHCRGILDAGHRYVGIGYAKSDGSVPDHFWTQLFVR
jgi:uncharacterized protein YkwD